MQSQWQIIPDMWSEDCKTPWSKCYHSRSRSDLHVLLWLSHFSWGWMKQMWFGGCGVVMDHHWVTTFGSSCQLWYEAFGASGIASDPNLICTTENSPDLHTGRLESTNWREHDNYEGLIVILHCHLCRYCDLHCSNNNNIQDKSNQIKFISGDKAHSTNTDDHKTHTHTHIHTHRNM